MGGAMGFFAVTIDEANRPQRIEGKATDLELRRRIPTSRHELTDFFISEPFGFCHDPTKERKRFLEIVVPARTADSASDLASIPTWLGWIAAKTGPNLPAALIHDVLVVKTDRDGELKKGSKGQVLTPVNHWWRKEGQNEFTKATKPYEPADRRRADQMFRDGMGDAGVDSVRRWLMWAAVATATLWDQRPRGIRGWVDAARVIILLTFAAAGAVLLPYLLLDIANVGWLPSPLEGSVWTDLAEAGVFAAGLTALACAVTGLSGVERHQWVLGLLVPAAVLLSWAVAATVLGGVLLGTIRQFGKTRRVRYVGRVHHFYGNLGVAVVDIDVIGLKVGDQISVLGPTTRLGRGDVESIEVERKSIDPVTGRVDLEDVRVEHVQTGRVAVKVKMDAGQRLR